jgi:hypothetical protein
LGVSLDVFPLGISRGGDVSVQRLSLPANLKRGQTFDAKIFVNSDKPQPATVRLYRNDQLLGQQRVVLEAGKNLFTFPQTLNDPDFYRYQVGGRCGGHGVAKQRGQWIHDGARKPAPGDNLLGAEKDRPLAQALQDGR